MLPIWIAGRYLFSRNHARFAPLITFTALAGVAVGMASLVFIMSVMKGFRAELSEKLIGFNAHVTITKTGGASALKRGDILSMLRDIGVKSVAEFAQGEVIAESMTTGETAAVGARVRGVDLDKFFEDKPIKLLKTSIGPREDGGHNAVAGFLLAETLVVHPDFYDELTLTAPLSELAPNGELTPNRMKFNASGVFKTGVFDNDSKYILTSVADAKKLLGLQALEGWLLTLDDADDSERAVEVLASRLPEGWGAEGWHEQNKRLFSALRLERAAMMAVLAMVLVIASFSIIGAVLLTIGAKRKDSAILQSFGMGAGVVRRVYMSHAGFIGAFGSAFGYIAGISACALLKRYPVRLPESYYLDWLPVHIEPVSSLGFAFAGVAIAVLVSMYPVKRAVTSTPAEVLRYE